MSTTVFQEVLPHASFNYIAFHREEKKQEARFFYTKYDPDPGFFQGRIRIQLIIEGRIRILCFLVEEGRILV